MEGDLHPRAAVLLVASLGRNRRGWHGLEWTSENVEGVEEDVS